MPASMSNGQGSQEGPPITDMALERQIVSLVAAREGLATALAAMDSEIATLEAAAARR